MIFDLFNQTAENVLIAMIALAVMMVIIAIGSEDHRA
jgi:hypothetical protein